MSRRYRTSFMLAATDDEDLQNKVGGLFIGLYTDSQEWGPVTNGEFFVTIFTGRKTLLMIRLVLLTVASLQPQWRNTTVVVSAPRTNFKEPRR